MEELLFNPDEGKTILKPEGTGEGYWIGAPSIYFDKDSGKFYLYVRIRNPRPKEKGVTPEDTHRGYKCQILESKNGKDFKIIWEVTKKQIGVKSIEGASIIKVDNLYHMFFSFETHARIPRWQIKKMTAIHPTEFGLNKVKPIDWDLPHLHRLSIKDPIIRENFLARKNVAIIKPGMIISIKPVIKCDHIDKIVNNKKPNTKRLFFNEILSLFTLMTILMPKTKKNTLKSCPR